MSGQGHIDDSARAALARLTENEKQCLRRRLLPQTAKEMAIELGVSPHAVEKRLKMARTKLGLSSSLDAARLLAAAEGGYQPPVPQPPDLALQREPDQIAPHAAPGSRRRIVHLTIGAISMSMILAALFVLAPAQQQTAPPEPGPGMRKASLEDATAYIIEGFRSHDRDKSGFLEPTEASRLEPRDALRDPKLPPAPAPGALDPAAESKWVRMIDRNGDRRVSQDEYLSYMTPWILLSGVPVDWKPKA